jgi:hypothetical protein
MKIIKPSAALLRAMTGLGLAAALATGGLLTATAAQAQTVTGGTFTVSGDAGDYVSGGQSYSYSTDSGAQMTVSATPNDSNLTASVTGPDGNTWGVTLEAPNGAALTPGSYANAINYFDTTVAQPGLDFYNGNRFCWEGAPGDFTVTKAVFGPHGYVQEFDASFDQRCDTSTTATAHGQIHIVNPAPPADLKLDATVATTGGANSLDGTADVSGTVTCNKPVQVNVSGQATQNKNGVLTNGSFTTSVACTPGAPTAWSAAAAPTGSTPFKAGDIALTTNLSAVDPDYNIGVTNPQTTTTVHLTPTHK